MKKSTVHDCSILEFKKNHQIKGNLTAIESSMEIPFEVKRCYYLYDVPGGETRGGHAHKNLTQLIIAASGSFDVCLDDGLVKRHFTLSCPYHGLLVCPGIWRDLDSFSSGAVCLVLASDLYDEFDYIHSYADFLKYKKCVYN